MSKQLIVSIFLLATVLAMGALLGGATWWNRWRAPVTVEARTATPLNEILRTDEDPSRPDHNNDLRPDPSVQLAKATAARMPMEEIQERLDEIGPEIGGPERVEMESALGYALLEREQPDLRRVGVAFTTALDYTPSPDARVPMARDFGLALLDHRGEVEVIDVTSGGRFIGAQLSPERLEIEAIRGIAFDALGLGIRAQDTFHEAFETILDTTLHESEGGRDVARTLGLRLARKYRDAGDLSLAKAVSVRLRAWLGEEDLVLR
jgi:hypothetical protein